MVAAFDGAGATSPDAATAPDEIGVEMHGFAWRRMIEQAVIREASPGRFYVDMVSWHAVRRSRMRRLLILFAIVVALAAWFLAPGHPVSGQ
jgi:hypothetical protein